MMSSRSSESAGKVVSAVANNLRTTPPDRDKPMKNRREKSKKTQDASRQETTESLAVLAGGMADDFNNILTTVMGACALIDKDESANSELVHCVSLIRSSAEHAADLSDRLMRASILKRGGTGGSDTSSARDKSTINDIVSPKNTTDGATT